jgi:hypothetical protein
MVAAGSVVLCDSVLPDADACGVAFRVALWLAPLPRVRTSRRARLAATHDVLKVVWKMFVSGSGGGVFAVGSANGEIKGSPCQAGVGREMSGREKNRRGIEARLPHAAPRASTRQRVAVMRRTHPTTDESLYLIKRSIVSAAMASNPSNRGSVP